jgi:hypothetical protein
MDDPDKNEYFDCSFSRAISQRYCFCSYGVAVDAREQISLFRETGRHVAGRKTSDMLLFGRRRSVAVLRVDALLGRRSVAV